MNLDKAFGIHATAVALRSQRAELLASNLANADTPGFKARDVDFKSVLQGASDQAVALQTTHAGHISDSRGMFSAGQLQYRQPHQASLDGNTVDTQVEQAEFTKNAMQYQASLRFLTGRISGLVSAFRGE